MDYSKRSFFFLVMLVALPSILLSVFAVQALVGQRVIIKERIKESYYPLARTSCSEIIKALNVKTREIEQKIIDFEKDQKSSIVESFSSEDPFFERWFVIGSQYQIVYPKPPTRSSRDFIGFVGNYKIFDRAHNLEQQGKYQEAIKAFQESVPDSLENEEECYSLMAIARCYHKLQLFPEAENTYKKILSDESISPHHHIRARYLLSKLQKKQNHISLCYENYLTLLEEIILNENFLGESLFQMYHSEIQNQLQNLKALLSEEDQLYYHKKFEKIKNRHQQMQLQKESIQVADFYIAAIKKHFARGEREGFVWLDVEDEKHLIYFSKVNGINNDFGFVVYLIDLKYFVRTIILPIIQGQGNDKNLLINITDERENPIFDIADGQYPMIISQSLEPVLPFWYVSIYLKNIHSLEELTQYHSHLYFGGIIIIILVLFVGVYGSTLTFIREMKTARMKSDFVSNVTHELKTPLTSIKMFVETLLMERTQSEEDRQECLQIIAAESERLSKLIDRILDFAKMEQKKRRFYLGDENIGEVVNEAVAQFKKQTVGKCEIRVEVEENLPVVSIDKEAIAEALLNLLSNAYKYTIRKDKEIVVSASLSKEHIVVSVRDNGNGIPKNEFQRIFQKFYRVQDSHTRHIEGTGLGLSLVASIVKAHSGKVKVRSKLGHGSKFSIKLPIKHQT